MAPSVTGRYGIGDSVGMAVRLEERYKSIRSPHKIKGGVSGCVRWVSGHSLAAAYIRETPELTTAAQQRVCRSTGEGTSASSPPTRAGTSTSEATAGRSLDTPRYWPRMCR